MNAQIPIAANPILPASLADRLIVLARETTGFLNGAVGAPEPDWYRPGGDNGPVLRTLHDALAAEYGAAGPPFRAVRMWTNLVWQPAYLAFVGIHFAGVLPDLSGMSQRCAGIHADGYRIAGEPLTGLSESEMIARAGGQLRAMADDLLIEINAIIKLKRLPALRLLTDRMLGLMTFLQRKRPDLAPHAIRAICTEWLVAMGLVGQGDLESLFLADGREVLIIARKGCCLDYLIEPAVYCASCPKQPDDLRRAHQRAETEALLRAG